MLDKERAPKPRRAKPLLTLLDGRSGGWYSSGRGSRLGSRAEDARHARLTRGLVDGHRGAVAIEGELDLVALGKECVETEDELRSGLSGLDGVGGAWEAAGGEKQGKW